MKNHRFKYRDEIIDLSVKLFFESVKKTPAKSNENSNSESRIHDWKLNYAEHFRGCFFFKGINQR